MKSTQAFWTTLAAVGAITLLTTAARGQALQSPAEQIRQPELQQQQASIGQSLLEPSSGAVNGDDLILLDEHSLFYARAGESGGFTSNAFVDGDARHDWLSLFSAEAGASTVLEDGIGLRLGANTQIARYEKYKELNFDSIGGVAEVSKQFGQVMFSLDYLPTQYHEHEYSDVDLQTHPIVLSAVWEKSIRPDVLFTLLGDASYTWANPSQYENAALGGTASLSYQAMTTLVFQSGVDLRFTFYRDFYGDVYDKDRRDAVLTPFISAIWTPKEWLSFAATLSYSRAFSTLQEYDYDSTNITPSVQAVIRF